MDVRLLPFTQSVHLRVTLTHHCSLPPIELQLWIEKDKNVIVKETKAVG